MSFAAKQRARDEVEAGALRRMRRMARSKRPMGSKMKLRTSSGPTSRFRDADKRAAKAQRVRKNATTKRNPQSGAAPLLPLHHAHAASQRSSFANRVRLRGDGAGRFGAVCRRDVSRQPRCCAANPFRGSALHPVHPKFLHHRGIRLAFEVPSDLRANWCSLCGSIRTLCRHARSQGKCCLLFLSFRWCQSASCPL